MSFKLEQMATQVGGHLWWRRYSKPYDVVEWMEVFHPGSPYELMQDWFSEVDTQLIHDVSSGVWRTGSWKLGAVPVPKSNEPGETVVLAMQFLSGEERARAWAEYGWGDG